MRSWSQLSTPCHCFDSRVRTFLGFEIHFPGDGSYVLALPGTYALQYPSHLFFDGHLPPEQPYAGKNNFLFDLMNELDPFRQNLRL